MTYKLYINPLGKTSIMKIEEGYVTSFSMNEEKQSYYLQDMLQVLDEEIPLDQDGSKNLKCISIAASKYLKFYDENKGFHS
jgi:hypothetical protein